MLGIRFFLVPRLCLGMPIQRLCLRGVDVRTEPNRRTLFSSVRSNLSIAKGDFPRFFSSVGSGLSGQAAPHRAWGFLEAVRATGRAPRWGRLNLTSTHGGQSLGTQRGRKGYARVFVTQREKSLTFPPRYGMSSRLVKFLEFKSGYTTCGEMEVGMKRRVFWLLLIPSILFILFDFHLYPTSSTPATFTKDPEPVPSLKPALNTGADLEVAPSREDLTPVTPAHPDREFAAGLQAKESNAAPSVTDEDSVTITDVEYWLAPDQTQVVINLDRRLNAGAYRTFTLADPPRFVVELARGRYLQGKQTIQIYDKAVKTIRLQRLNSGRFQVVFDLVQPQVESKVLSVEKVNDQPDRLMVMITHPREKEVESQKKQQAVRNLKRQNYKIVVIDPGHGGSDSGAIGRSGAMEKHIVLNIARKLKALLDQTGDIKAYLTRDGDYFLSLAKRTQIAREYGADLFISIHVNANYDTSMNGFSVYCLSQKATDEATKLLAQRENASDYLGGVVFDQQDPELNEILFDLSQSASLNRSLEFGVLTLDKAIPFLKVRNEGLKRANFAVLRAPDIPSVLVEALYISNPSEEQLLINPAMQDRIAWALHQSATDYFERFHASHPDKNENLTPLPHPETSVKVRPTSLFPVRQASAENKSPSLSGELISSRSAPPSLEVPIEGNFRTHIVKEGETLWRIATLYKVEVNLLVEVNQLKNHTIYTGQKLKIP